MSMEINTEPYLSICIPTYNRAVCLAKCLESIVSQLPLEQPVEICISDNASTDHTQEIAMAYVRRYSFIHYRRNAVNIGGDRNIYEVPGMAKGKFIKLQGDDDYFRPGTLAILLNALQQNEDCTLLSINVLKNDLAISHGEGLSSFLRTTSIYSAFITSIVFRKKDWVALNLSDQFLETSFHQTYLQYSLLKQSPRFCILNCSMFTYAGMAAAEMYNVGKTFIEGYPSILHSFVGKGITQEDYDYERKMVLFNVVIPGIRIHVSNKRYGQLTDFKKIYIKNYQDEPYFEEGLSLINAILPH